MAQCKQPQLVKLQLNFDINFIFKSAGTAIKIHLLSLKNKKDKGFHKILFNLLYRCTLLRGLTMIIAWITPTSSVKHFFVLLRNNISLLGPEKMLWLYLILVPIKFLEFPRVHTSNLQFHCFKISSVIRSDFSMMESLLFLQTFNAFNDVGVICLDNPHPNNCS